MLRKTERKIIQKKEQGITLIALIVTIIVLLILSGISIAMLTGNNGILDRGAEASSETKKAELIERIKIDILENELVNMGNITSSDLRTILNNYFLGVPETLPESAEELKELELTSREGAYKIKVGEIYKGTLTGGSGGTELPETAEGQPAGTAIKNPESYGENPKAQATADGDGKYFAKPIGATYVKGTVDTGVVINIDDSEFVWVPVPDAIFDESKTDNLPTSDLAGTKQGNTYTPMAIETSAGNYSGLLYSYLEDNAYLQYPSVEKYQGTTSEYREPDIVNYDGGNKDTVPEKVTKEKLQTAYNEMISKVAQYGGFYVGRYEMGIEEDKIVSKNASQNTAVTTADASKTETKTWYGLYQAGEKFETTAKVKSSMIWGSQYDAMMNWMVKTGETVGTKDDNKYNQETITGKSDTDIINNVYDLYGCHYDWTLEASGTHNRAKRGGDDYGDYSPSFRNGNYYPDLGYSFESSRLTLYIE